MKGLQELPDKELSLLDAKIFDFLDKIKSEKARRLYKDLNISSPK
jgi:hypothetical protein